ASFRPWLLFAVRTGTRKGENRSLRWSSVDLEAKTLCVEAPNAKSGRQRWIPIAPSLLDELRRMALSVGQGGDDGDHHVFVTARGRPWTEWDIRREFDRALA